MISEKVKELNQKSLEGEEVTGFLANLIKSDTISEDEILGNVADLMMTAVDTVSGQIVFPVLCP